MVGCDRPKDNPVLGGQSYVDQARAVSAGEHERSIDLAKGMIQAGRLTDAERLLDEVGAKDLPAATREKLDEAKRQLAAARAAN